MLNNTPVHRPYRAELRDGSHVRMPEGSLDWQKYPVASLYDSIGKKYEMAYSGIPAQEKSLQWILSKLPRTGCRILDIGCGTGRPAASTLASSPGFHIVHGIDISDGMLAVAREHVPSATFQQVDLRDFRAEPSTFDAIVSYFAFLVAISQQQIEEILGRIFVWLKPGGLLVLSTIPADVEHFQHTWLGLEAVFTSLSEDSYITMLENIGFVVEYHETQDFLPKAALAGICADDEVTTESQLFVYAKKPKE